ncbi:serine/threonine protein kinase [Sulfurihydrogenibium sp.]|uniref:serine/threonine protein kinase n=1 Tax=Sulfurihydrogenibium sp. TaxID=2053621 RepID=UPI002638D0A8|nr:serine/threonine protein kinase [Sulfurihydrogenibium sp.]
MITFENIRDEIGNLKIIGEGWRAKVYRGKYQDKDLSFKVASQEIHKHPIQKEGQILKIVNQYGIGGKLFLTGEDFVAYEYIEGTHLNKVLNEENFKILISQLLDQAYILDKLKIDKGEMHKPYSNVLVDKNLKVYLIDFERATKSLKPKNVLNLVQFITRGKERNEKLMNILKEYKESQSEENYNKIKSYVLNLK